MFHSVTCHAGRTPTPSSTFLCSPPPFLPLPNHAVTSIIEKNDFNRQLVLRSGRQFLQVHLEAAFTGNTDDHLVWKRFLRPDSRWETKAHRPQPTRGQPRPRLCPFEVLRRPHLVLAHVRGDNRFVLRRS